MSNVQSSSWAQGAPPKSRRGLVATAIILGVLLIAVVIVAALALRGLLPFGAASSASAEDQTLTLEPANSLGQDPFAGTSLAATVTAAPTAAASGTVNLSTGTATGTAPGLYGGSGDPAVCKVDQLVTFLQANPAKAQAWVDAFNADPNLRWTLGRLTVADIPKYVAGLTAVVLNADTRVTNHGFSDSSASAYPLQSLLQKGTAVLVDKYGVPRVKCNCGNPLLPPQALTPPPSSSNPPPGTTPSPSQTPCLPPPIVVPDGQGPDNTCEPSVPDECASESFDGCDPATTTEESPPAEGEDPGDPGTAEECEGNFDETTGRFDLGCPSNPFPFETTGTAWEGLGDDPITVADPSATPVTQLQVTDPANPLALTTIPTGCQANGQCTLPDDVANPNVAAAAPVTTDPSTPATTDPSASPSASAPVTPEGYGCDSTDPSIDTTVTYTGSITNSTSSPMDIWIVAGGCQIRYLNTIPAGATDSSYSFFGDVYFIGNAGTPAIIGSVNGRGADFAVTF